MAAPFTLSTAEQRYLGTLARWAITSGLAATEQEGRGGREADSAPGDAPGTELAAELAQAPPTENLRALLGCFVTLNLQGRLRGCIGSIVGQEPLYKNVAHMAAAAAFQDPRFPPLSAAEWRACACEISVLGPLEPCPDPESIEIGRHGLVLQMRGHAGVFLPKVPLEAGWNRLEYLDQLCRKASLPKGLWREADARLFCFEAFVFGV